VSAKPKLKWESSIQFNADFSDELNMCVRQQNIPDDTQRYRWTVFRRNSDGTHLLVNFGYSPTLHEAFLAAEEQAARAEQFAKAQADATEEVQP